MITETIIDHPRLRVMLKEGTEGPQHDPYGYRELHVMTPDGKTVLHEGLGVWLKHNGSRYEPVINQHLPWYEREKIERCFVRKAFSAFVHYTPEQLERIAIKVRSRCGKCGGREFSCESGYPGETFNVCRKCGHINSSRMDYSAIE